MIKKVQHIYELNKVMRNQLIAQTNLANDHVLNGLSIHGNNLEKRLEEQIFDSFAIIDSFIVFSLEPRYSASDNSQLLDDGKLLVTSSYNFKCIIYGGASMSLAQIIKARFESEEVRQNLFASGVYIEKITEPTPVNEFINQTMWLRSDISILISCETLVDKVDTSFEFEQMGTMNLKVITDKNKSGKGIISGYALDEITGQGIADITVEVFLFDDVHYEGEQIFETITDQNGYYQTELLEFGDYDIIFEDYSERENPYIGNQITVSLYQENLENQNIELYYETEGSFLGRAIDGDTGRTITWRNLSVYVYADEECTDLVYQTTIDTNNGYYYTELLPFGTYYVKFFDYYYPYPTHVTYIPKTIIVNLNKPLLEDQNVTLYWSNVAFDPVFRNNSWETIGKVIKNYDRLGFPWNLGDSKPIRGIHPNDYVEPQKIYEDEAYIVGVKSDENGAAYTFVVESGCEIYHSLITGTRAEWLGAYYEYENTTAYGYLTAEEIAPNQWVYRQYEIFDQLNTRGTSISENNYFGPASLVNVSGYHQSTKVNLPYYNTASINWPERGLPPLMEEFDKPDLLLNIPSAFDFENAILGEGYPPLESYVEGTGVTIDVLPQSFEQDKSNPYCTIQYVPYEHGWQEIPVIHKTRTICNTEITFDSDDHTYYGMVPTYTIFRGGDNPIELVSTYNESQYTHQHTGIFCLFASYEDEEENQE